MEDKEVEQRKIELKAAKILARRNKISRFVCLFFGHKFYTMASRDDGLKVEGYVRCQRCIYQENFQFVYRSTGTGIGGQIAKK